MIVILIDFLWVKGIVVGITAIPVNVKLIDYSDIQIESLWFIVLI